MIINEKKLKKYLSLENYDFNELQDLINNNITEINTCSVLEPNNHLIIGQIVKFEKIPDSKKLSLVTVDIKNTCLKIICGAANLVQDKKVAVATIGAYLKTIKTSIQQKNILGIESQGMICSAQELGLNSNALIEEEKKGILLLDDDAPIGENVLDYLNLRGFFLKLNITPDRGDLLSYIGFAKDLKAIYNKVKLNDFDSSLEYIQQTKNPFQIQIQNDHCQEYHMLYMENVKVTTSPLWLRSFLFNHNITSVNNIIDITNLVLLEYGIPLDILDVSHLNENQIQIRNAFEAEANNLFISDKNISLDKEDIVVASGSKILSLLGVPTSFSNIFNKNTHKIIISSYYLNSSYITKTNKKFNKKNEKNLHLNRGIDSSLIFQALKRAGFLLQQLNKEFIISDIVSQKIKYHQNPDISLSLDFIKNKISVDLSLEEVQMFLKKLDYEIDILNNKILKVKAPLRRYDVLIPEDVCSDIIRVYGFNKLQRSITNPPQNYLINKKREILYKLKDLLTYLGFYEIITYNLVSFKNFNLFSQNQDHLQVAKPISQENIVLRQYLSGSMIETLSYNQTHNNYNNAFFEISKVYLPQSEQLHLSLGLSGNISSFGWSNPNNIVGSFFVLKGVLERIGLLLGCKLDLQQTSSYISLHPSKQANILYKNKKIGFIGEVHPVVIESYNLKDSFLLEMILDNNLLDNSKKFIFEEITKFPSIIRDLSFFVSKKYSFQEIFQTLKNEMSDVIIKCELLDLYEDNQSSSEEHSLSFRFVFNNKNKSLFKESINNIMTRIEEKIKTIYKAKLR